MASELKCCDMAQLGGCGLVGSPAPHHPVPSNFCSYANGKCFSQGLCYCLLEFDLLIKLIDRDSICRRPIGELCDPYYGASAPCESPPPIDDPLIYGSLAIRFSTLAWSATCSMTRIRINTIVMDVEFVGWVVEIASFTAKCVTCACRCNSKSMDIG